MKRFLSCTALLPVFAVVSGCASTMPSALPDSKAPLLSGMSWTATIVENDFTAGRRPTIQFREDGKTVGTTGCTIYVASAKIVGSTIRIRNLDLEPAAERPGTCDSLHLAQQVRFLGALKSTRFVRKQSDKILLLDVRQKLLVLLERREDPQASNSRMVSEVVTSLPDLATNPRDDAASFWESYSANDPLAGVELVAITPALGQYFGADSGVLVTRAPTDNLFELREGDVIVSINGRQPANGAHALRMLRSYPPGTPLNVQVLRRRERLNLRIMRSD